MMLHKGTTKEKTLNKKCFANNFVTKSNVKSYWKTIRKLKLVVPQHPQP